MSILNDEMRDMLVDSASKFVSTEYEFETRQKLASTEQGYSDENWQMFAELGWLSIPFPEDFGGLGGTVADLAGLAEQLGYGLVLEPWFASIVLAGQAIVASDNNALKEQLIPSLATGESILSLAWEERNGGSNPLQIETTAKATENGYQLEGKKCLVQAAPQASGFIVSARLENSNLGLFYIPSDRSGLEINNYALVDGSKAADIELSNVLVEANEVLSTDGEAQLLNVIKNAAYVASAEALGCMEKLLETTANYTKERKQFGQPIANFQALRHFLADMYVVLKKTRCYHEVCTRSLQKNGTLSDEEAAVLKAQTGRAGHHIGRQSIQIHGGIGMTDELNVGHYVKRLAAIDAMLGNSRYQIQFLASEL